MIPEVRGFHLYWTEIPGSALRAIRKVPAVVKTSENGTCENGISQRFHMRSPFSCAPSKAILERESTV